MRALPILLCIGVGAGSSTAALAATPSPASTASPDRVEITIAPSVGDVEVMDRWMQLAAGSGMNDAGVTWPEVADDRTLVIEIEGSLLEYEYFVGVRTPDGWAGPAQSASCECRDQQLIDGVRLAVSKLGPQLRPPAPDASPAASKLRPARRLGPGGIAGATLLGVGGAAVLGGILMLALPPKWSVDEDDPGLERGKTLRLPGAIVAGAGVALVTVGAVLLHRDRTKRRATVAPTAGRRGFGVAAVVRF